MSHPGSLSTVILNYGIADLIVIKKTILRNDWI